jgi:transcription antitermination factor NusG
MEGAGKPSLHRAPHVSGWVNFEGVAPEVSEEVVCELAGRVENINEAGGMWRTFKAGDKVRVLSGKFESLGEVIDPGTSANHKVRILMEFMGRLISAQVPWSNLQPLESIANEKLRAPRRTRGHGRWIRNSEPALIGSS